MSSSLRSISALLGLVLAVPLTAQTSAMKSKALIATTAASTLVKADTAVTWVELRSNEGELRGKLPQLVKAEIAKAKAMGRTPFLEVGATWCGPCKELEASIHNKDIIDAFAGAYIIHLDVNEWDIEEDMEPLGFRGGVMPIILALNKNGKGTSQLNGQTTAEPIKKYVQANTWNKF